MASVKVQKKESELEGSSSNKPVVPPRPTKSPGGSEEILNTPKTIGLKGSGSPIASNPALPNAADKPLLQPLRTPSVKPAKKGILNNLVSSVQGMFVAEQEQAAARPTISTPFNPVHITHVGYDHEAGEFTVIAINLGIAPAMEQYDKGIWNFETGPSK
jgi:hypothetical protein